MARLRFTILGCGSSGGVPRIGGLWGDCDPDNPRNRRRRCSLLVERIEAGATTRVLIDTTPDMRAQLLDAGVGTLDAVVYTHAHADHVHGIDDLRMVVYNMRETTGQRLAVWADPATQDSLVSRFGYAFVQPPGSPYPPILNINTIDGPFVIEGPGGTIRLEPFEVMHGRSPALGFRIGDLAYVPDVSDFPPAAIAALDGLDTLIIDALRRDPHPTHLNLAQALDWIARLGPGRAIITNMHIDLDHDRVEAETPAHVHPAHDGMVLESTV